MHPEADGFARGGHGDDRAVPSRVAGRRQDAGEPRQHAVGPLQARAESGGSDCGNRTAHQLQPEGVGGRPDWVDDPHGGMQEHGERPQTLVHLVQTARTGADAIGVVGRGGDLSFPGAASRTIARQGGRPLHQHRPRRVPHRDWSANRGAGSLTPRRGRGVAGHRRAPHGRGGVQRRDGAAGWLGAQSVGRTFGEVQRGRAEGGEGARTDRGGGQRRAGRRGR